jgi:hypothetical protein
MATRPSKCGLRPRTLWEAIRKGGMAPYPPMPPRRHLGGGVGRQLLPIAITGVLGRELAANPRRHGWGEGGSTVGRHRSEGPIEAGGGEGQEGAPDGARQGSGRSRLSERCWRELLPTRQPPVGVAPPADLGPLP